MMGTVFDGRDKAFDFELSNQYGQKVSLADFRGQIVVLTFVYTSCSDTCPIVTSHLKKLYDMLGEQVECVVFLAVSGDPKRDALLKMFYDLAHCTCFSASDLSALSDHANSSGGSVLAKRLCLSR